VDHPLEEKYLSIDQKQRRKPRILVAALDWGLGHATRCIPIINELLRQHCEVWLAGEGAQEIILKKQFPDLPFLSLPGYRIRYAKSGFSLIKNILIQAPKILRAIKYENLWLKKMVSEQGFDAVISDNRFGLYHPEVYCVFITHQLAIKSPLGKGTERILQIRNYSYINRFDECWVPDEKGKNNLAGELSHPQKMPDIPVHYIGLLSRFYGMEFSEQRGKLLVMISGPEPQRSLFENKIIKEITNHDGCATVVRGLPGEAKQIPSTNMIRFYNHLGTAELNKEMMEADYIVARSGYSTIMDIVTLQKKSVLIPTPGQTEQQYLGKYLLQKQIALVVSQKEFSLIASLQKALQFNYVLPSIENERRLQQIVSELIIKIIH